MQLSPSQLLIAVSVVTGVVVCCLMLTARWLAVRGSRPSPVRDRFGMGKLLVLGALLTAGLVAVPLLGLGELGAGDPTSSGSDGAEPGQRAGRHGSPGTSSSPRTGVLLDDEANDVADLRQQVIALQRSLQRLETDLAAAQETKDAYAQRLDDYQQTINQLTADLALAQQLAAASETHDTIREAAREGRRPNRVEARYAAEYDELRRYVAGRLVKVAQSTMPPAE